MGHPPLAKLVSEQVRKNNIVLLKVYGFSMMPLLWPNVTLTIEAMKDKDPMAKDIVAVARDNHVVCHEVHHIEERGATKTCWIRGIANLHGEPPALREDLIGIVTKVRYGPVAVPTRSLLFSSLRAWGEKLGPFFGLVRAFYLGFLRRSTPLIGRKGPGVL